MSLRLRADPEAISTPSAPCSRRRGSETARAAAIKPTNGTPTVRDASWARPQVSSPDSRNALYAGIEETSKALPASSQRQIWSGRRDDGKECSEKFRKPPGPAPNPASTTSSNSALPRSARVGALSTPQKATAGSCGPRDVHGPKRRSSSAVLNPAASSQRATTRVFFAPTRGKDDSKEVLSFETAIRS